MKKILLAIFLLLVASSSCAISQTQLAHSPVVTTTSGISEPVLSKTPEITVTIPFSTPVVSASEQGSISLEVANICPKQRVVSFEKLELPKGLRLLLLPSTVESSHQLPGKPLIISSESSVPEAIFEDELYDYAVSPDHKWIYFDRPSPDGKYPVLWISSLDGHKQWPVIQLGGDGFTGYASWVSEQAIFIIGSPKKNEISALDPWEYMPFMSINPFTLEQHRLTYLARDQKEGLFYYGSATVDRRPFGMYGRLNRVDFLYDFENDQTLPVFSWLEEVDPFDMQFVPPIWAYDDGKFAVTVARPNGIDLAFDLNIQSAQDKRRYEDVMKRITFPERLLPTTVLGIIPSTNFIALQRFDFSDFSKGKKWFYILDYNNQTVYDYCLDLQDSVKRVKFSPDGKFVAFSLEDFAASLEQDQHYVAILNLEKGTTSYLRGYTLVNWGIVEP